MLIVVIIVQKLSVWVKTLKKYFHSAGFHGPNNAPPKPIQVKLAGRHAQPVHFALPD